jgi:hypothetical protein
MAVQREDDLAWQLVEQYRDLLTTEECTALFVDLGVGDYSAVIRSVLTAVGAQSKALSDRSVADVRAWIDCYQADVEFTRLLAEAVKVAGSTG